MNFKKLLLVSLISLNIGGMLYGSKAIDPGQAFRTELVRDHNIMTFDANLNAIPDDQLIGHIVHFVSTTENSPDINRQIISTLFATLIMKVNSGFYTQLNTALQRVHNIEIPIDRELIIDSIKMGIKILVRQAALRNKITLRHSYEQLIRSMPPTIDEQQITITQAGPRILIPGIPDDQVLTKDDIGFSVREIIDMNLTDTHGDETTMALHMVLADHITLNGCYINSLDGLQSLPNDTVSINLANNKLTTIEKNEFDRFTNLIQLRLEQNKIEVIPNNIFDNMPRLSTLGLHENKIKVIPNNIFDRLTRLKFLTLSNNEIEVIPNNIFDELINLERLMLYKNRISNLPNTIFSRLTNLRTLILSFNNLENNIPHDIFNGLINLQELVLNNNNIEALPNNIFSHFRPDRIRQILLGNNPIYYLPISLFGRNFTYSQANRCCDLLVAPTTATVTRTIAAAATVGAGIWAWRNPRTVGKIGRRFMGLFR